MINCPKNQLDPRAKYVFRWEGAFFSLLGLALTILLIIGHYQWRLPLWLARIAASGTLLCSIYLIGFKPDLLLQRWLYEIKEDEIHLQRGILFHERTVIPMIRVQHVDTKQGPLLRAYKLTSVTFSTAAGSHEIPALSNEAAEQVRDQIAAFAKVPEDDL